MTYGVDSAAVWMLIRRFKYTRELGPPDSIRRGPVAQQGAILSRPDASIVPSVTKGGRVHICVNRRLFRVLYIVIPVS